MDIEEITGQEFTQQLIKLGGAWTVEQESVTNTVTFILTRDGMVWKVRFSQWELAHHSLTQVWKVILSEIKRHGVTL